MRKEGLDASPQAAEHVFVDRSPRLGYDCLDEGRPMKATEAVRAIANDAGMNLSDIARQEGVTPQAVQKRLNGGGCTARSLCRMLETLDYALIAVPKGTEVPEKSYLIDA